MSRKRALPRWLLSILAAVLALGIVPIAQTQAEAASYAAPSAVRVLSTSKSAVSLSWTAVKGATRYSVEYSTSSKMKGAKHVRVSGTQLDLTKLKSSKTYYIRVRVIPKSGNPGPFSKTIKVKTPWSKGYSKLAPVNLRATTVTDISIKLAWASRGSGTRYRIAYSTKSSFTRSVYKEFTSASGTVTGLAPGTTYYVRVRVINSKGAVLSAYGPATKVKTAQPTSAYAAPSGLKLHQIAQTSALLSWTAVKGAPGYRLEASTSSSFKDPVSRQLGSVTSVELSGLTKGKTYYFRISATSAAGIRASGFSGVVKAATPSNAGSQYLSPAGIQVVSRLATRIRLSWSSRGAGLKYEVRYATKADFSDAKSVTSATTSATVTGLKATTKYYVQVRVLVSGKVRSKYGPSPAFSLTTAATDAVRLTIASYNVKCSNCYSGVANEGTWYQRRDAVVSTVLAQAPDVIGFQEAGQAWLKDSKGKSISLSQFEDLEDRLGAPYKVTNSNRNNCVKSTTPTNCVYKDQGASQGTKIFYNSNVLKLVKQGSKQLSELRSSDNDRYVAWAIFEDLRNGGRFFFADTHLEHVSDTGSSTKWFDLRVTQAKEALATIKANNPGLPVFLVGDLNSSKWTSPSNGPYDTILAAGYVDPLGNYYKSTTSTKGATVEKRIRTNFASYNGFSRVPPSKPTWVNASNIDYIFTSRGIRVMEWETSVNVDAAGKFVGQIPSDHNLIRATVELPGHD